MSGETPIGALAGRQLRSLGYLRVPELLSRSDATRIASRAVARSHTGLERVESAFSELGLRDEPFVTRLVGTLAPLIGPDIVLLKNRHNHATVNFGEGLRAERAHRDSLGWTQAYVTVLILLEGGKPATWPSILPASHVMSTIEPPNGGGSWLDEASIGELADQLLQVPMAPGDALLLDPTTYHRSGVGSRADPRVMLTLALRSPDELSPAIGPHEELIAGSHSYRGQMGWYVREGRDDVT